MANDLAGDIASIQSITSLPAILEAVAAVTNMRFVGIARVTGEAWIMCAVLDQLGIGVAVGDALDIGGILGDSVPTTGRAIVIHKLRTDPAYREHPLSRPLEVQRFISIPVLRPDGERFGCLCACDPVASNESGATTAASLTLLSQLITNHLETACQLHDMHQMLHSERETSELREQFIAMLGHDLRTPLGSILLGAELLERENLSPRAISVLERMTRSAQRMAGLVDNVVDFTRGRLGGAIAPSLQHEWALQESLMQVVEELRSAHPEHIVETHFTLRGPMLCDVQCIERMLANLLQHALANGDPRVSIKVFCASDNGIFELSIAAALPAHDGLGPGLFIASEIARAHGGELQVASSAGITSFTFRLKGSDFTDRRHLTR